MSVQDGDRAVAPFQRFMEECMERKNLKGQPREVVNEELAKCARAWKRIQDSLPVDTVDEEELARQHLQRRS